MAIINLLLVRLLLVISGFSFTEPEAIQKDCGTLNFKYSAEETGAQKFTVVITPAGGEAPYKIILSEESGNLISDDFTKTRFESLSKGKYICVVIDKAKCLTKSEINIQ
jgi:hypothetical protein